MSKVSDVIKKYKPFDFQQFDVSPIKQQNTQLNSESILSLSKTEFSQLTEQAFDLTTIEDQQNQFTEQDAFRQLKSHKECVLSLLLSYQKALAQPSSDFRQLRKQLNTEAVQLSLQYQKTLQNLQQSYIIPGSESILVMNVIEEFINKFSGLQPENIPKYNPSKQTPRKSLRQLDIKDQKTQVQINNEQKQQVKFVDSVSQPMKKASPQSEVQKSIKAKDDPTNINKSQDIENLYQQYKLTFQTQLKTNIYSVKESAFSQPNNQSKSPLEKNLPQAQTVTSQPFRQYESKGHFNQKCTDQTKQTSPQIDSSNLDHSQNSKNSLQNDTIKKQVSPYTSLHNGKVIRFDSPKTLLQLSGSSQNTMLSASSPIQDHYQVQEIIKKQPNLLQQQIVSPQKKIEPQKINIKQNFCLQSPVKTPTLVNQTKTINQAIEVSLNSNKLNVQIVDSKVTDLNSKTNDTIKSTNDEKSQIKSQVKNETKNYQTSKQLENDLSTFLQLSNISNINFTMQEDTFYKSTSVHQLGQRLNAKIERLRARLEKCLQKEQLTNTRRILKESINDLDKLIKFNDIKDIKRIVYKLEQLITKLGETSFNGDQTLNLYKLLQKAIVFSKKKEKIKETCQPIIEKQESQVSQSDSANLYCTAFKKKKQEENVSVSQLELENSKVIFSKVSNQSFEPKNFTQSTVTAQNNTTQKTVDLASQISTISNGAMAKETKIQKPISSQNNSNLSNKINLNELGPQNIKYSSQQPYHQAPGNQQINKKPSNEINYQTHFQILQNQSIQIYQQAKDRQIIVQQQPKKSSQIQEKQNLNQPSIKKVEQTYSSEQLKPMKKPELNNQKIQKVLVKYQSNDQSLQKDPPTNLNNKPQTSPQISNLSKDPMKGSGLYGKEVQNQFVHICLKVKSGLPENHPGRKILIFQLFDKVQEQQVPIEQWTSWVQKQMGLQKKD